MEISLLIRLCILFWLMSLIRQEQPLSICQNDKPFKTMENTCTNFVELCVKKDDQECNNFRSACGQCPPSNLTIVMYQMITRLLENQKKQEIKTNQINERVEKLPKTAELKTVLYLILALVIILPVLLYLGIHFRYKQKRNGLRSKKEKESVNEEFSDVCKLLMKNGSDLQSGEKFQELKSFLDSQVGERFKELRSFLDQNQNTKFQLKAAGTPIELYIHTDENIVQIKRKLVNKCRALRKDCYKTMELNYEGKVLDDNQYFFSCVRNRDVIINCEVNPSRKPNDIIVLNVQSKERIPELLQIKRTQTILELKKVISRLSHYEDWVIFSDSKNISTELMDHELLIESKLVDGDWIKVIIKKHEEILLKSIFEERERLVVEFESTDTVSTLNSNLANKFNSSPNNYALFFYNEHLDGTKLLFDYGIDRDSDVEFVCIRNLSDIEIIQEIDKGYYSVLLEAKIKSKNKGIVLKKYTEISIPNFNKNNILLNELSLFQTLHLHHRFLKLFGIYKDEEYFYIAMENMKGGSIKTNIKNNFPLDEKQIAFWSKQILEGLQYLHDQEFVYRDLKTSNILIDDQNNVKLPSLSLSKYLHNYDIKPEEMGYHDELPLRYMAPEILQEQTYGIKADTWSFGAILVEMITGNEPYSGLSEKEAKEKIINNKTIIYDTKSISKTLKEFISLCLTFNDEDRPSDNTLLKHLFLST